MAGGRKREWLRKKMATTVAGTPGAGGQQSSPRWALRVRALSAALRRRRHGHGAAAGLPRVDFLRRLYESVVFHLLWVIESAVVLATLCFFFLRFGFRL
jgi:hypothetical protein